MNSSPIRIVRRLPLALARKPRPSQRASSQPFQAAYHSNAFPEPSPFSPVETSILSAALSHVPAHGFTETSLVAGARDVGYRDATVNLFPRGVFDLISYHLAARRLCLKDEVQFQPETHLGVGAKVRALALHRLRANEPIIKHWQQALSIMAQPSYVPASLKELSQLADEIWFLAGDTAVDTSWYSKRATLAAVYSSADLFMTTDSSTGFVETEQFLDRRLEEVRSLGGAWSAVGEWASVSGKSFVNVLRSKGVGV